MQARRARHRERAFDRSRGPYGATALYVVLLRQLLQTPSGERIGLLGPVAHALGQTSVELLLLHDASRNITDRRS
ncbi:hypothetical protein ACVWZL_006997 [Bradyrhizobium sp. GM2.4]